MSSAYLEAVAQAAERRAASETDFRAALVRARQHHSLREIAPYAGMSFAGVAWLTKEEGSTDDERAR
jgi:hypothetical protein